MAENENKVQADSGQGRSPVSPMFTIDEAIKRARMLYDKDKRAWTTFENVAKHIGLTGTKRGGRTGRAVSALRQYGLLDENKGQYRISATAFKIFELPDSDPEREKLIRSTALTPSIVKKVLEYHNWELPSDETLRAYLIFQLKFTPDNATDFIKVVRRTSELVKESGEDYNTAESSEGEEIQLPPPPGEKPRMQPLQQQHTPPPGVKTPPPTPPKPPAGQRTYPLYLSHETEGVLYVPTVMTQTEYDLLKSQIETSLKVMLATAVVPDPQPYPRSAVWKNADHDQPVIVIGELGPGPDGLRYFKVQGSASGIPENELHFEDAQAKGAA